MKRTNHSDSIIEVEVERLPPGHEFSRESEKRARRERARKTFGPVLAGIVLDLADFATIGPLQAILGVPLGTVLGWQMFRSFRIPLRNRFAFALGCGLYCGLLPTNFLPIGTLLGACARFFWPEEESETV